MDVMDLPTSGYLLPLCSTLHKSLQSFISLAWFGPNKFRNYVSDNFSLLDRPMNTAWRIWNLQSWQCAIRCSRPLGNNHSLNPIPFSPSLPPPATIIFNFYFKIQVTSLTSNEFGQHSQDRIYLDSPSRT